MDQSRDNFAFTSNGFKNWKDATTACKTMNHLQAIKKLASGGGAKKICEQSERKNYGLTNPKMLPPPLGSD